MVGRWGYRLKVQEERALQFSYTYRPAWLFIPCFLFFPLGLLALLHKKTVDIELSSTPIETGARVSVVGEGPPYVRNQIGLILEEMADPVPNDERSTRP